MSGKPYTMREMKAIVEYLKEHRAYNDIKGRKMWMDLAKSNVTNRTWQSLKETFIKRILPDIHNPYYKLTVIQISSFRQAQDIETKLKNRLQIRSTSDNSDADAGMEEKEKSTVKPRTSNDQFEDKFADENPILTNLRASSETLVLENNYKTTEALRNDLQSPVDEDEENDETQAKSMRELITYSEPLTPMIQSVIDDCDTDDELNLSEIVEREETTGIDQEKEKENTIEISDSEVNDLCEQANQKPTQNTDINKPSSPNKIDQVSSNKIDQVSSGAKETDAMKEKSSTLQSQTNNINQKPNSSDVKDTKGDDHKSLSAITENNSVNNTDTLLPGNQEAYEENLNKTKSLNKKSNKRNVKKRTQSYELKLKEGSFNKKQTKSDTEITSPTNGDASNKSKLPISKQTLLEETQEPSSNMNNEKCSNTPVLEKEAAEDSLNTVTRNLAEIENPCLKNVSLYAEQFSTEKYTDTDTSNREVETNIKKKKINKRDQNIKKSEEQNKTNMSKRIKTSDKNNVTNATDDNAEGKNEGENNKVMVKNDEIDDKNKNDENEKTVNTIKKIDEGLNDEVVVINSNSESVNENQTNQVQNRQEQSVTKQRDRALNSVFGFANDERSRRCTRGRDSRNVTSQRNSHKYETMCMNTLSSEYSWTSDTGSEYVSSPPRESNTYRRRSGYRKYLRPRPVPIMSLEEEGGLFVIYGKKIYPIVNSGNIVKNYVSYLREEDEKESFWKLKYIAEKKKTEELTKILNQPKENKEEPSQVPPVLPTTAPATAQILNQPEENKEDPSQVPPVLPTTAPATAQNYTLPQEAAVQQVATTVPEPLPVTPVQETRPISEEMKTVKIKFTKNNEEMQLEGHWSQLNPMLAQATELFLKDPEPVAPITRSRTKFKPQEETVSVESGTSTPFEEVVEKVNQREIEIAAEIEKYYKEETTKTTEKRPETEINIKKRVGRPKKSLSAVGPPGPAKKAKLDETAEKTEESPSPAMKNTFAIRTRKNRTPSKLFLESSISPKKSLVAVTPQRVKAGMRYKLLSPPSATKTPRTNDSKQSTAAINTFKRRSKSATNLLPTRCKKYCTTHLQQRNNLNITDDISSDSSNSFQSAHIESMTFQNSDIYKSESYRLLMNKEQTYVKNTFTLSGIEEASLASEDIDINKEAYNPTIANIDSKLKGIMVEPHQVSTDNENSSNMSLPTSPVLSIVENISITKTLLSGMDLDDYDIDEKVDQVMLNELMSQEADVTMPLMERECEIKNSRNDGNAYHYKLSVSKTVAAVSASKLNKKNTVNIEDPTLCESLNVKLKDLLLESTKKTNKKTVNKETNEVEEIVKRESKKLNSRKRSSTPQKRQRKSKLKNTEPCIEEEHIESCSQRGRKSCPPIILISEHDGNGMNTPIETESVQFPAVKPRSVRKKKDIIKVKIAKPKSKTLNSSYKQDNRTNFTNCSINDTKYEINLQGSDDSVDIIHNHSDTCLNAHACMGDSIEIMDDHNSMILLDSSHANFNITVSHKTVGDLTQELFSSDAQDASDVVKDFAEANQVSKETNTVFHTPLGTPTSLNSIMTDDLSNEIPEKPSRTTKWYLFSEDGTNTNNSIDKNSEITGYAKLDQIFPVTCAVPDLSTITEMSTENGNSRKFCDNANTSGQFKSKLNSPSILI